MGWAVLLFVVFRDRVFESSWRQARLESSFLEKQTTKFKFWKFSKTWFFRFSTSKSGLLKFRKLVKVLLRKQNSSSLAPIYGTKMMSLAKKRRSLWIMLSEDTTLKTWRKLMNIFWTTSHLMIAPMLLKIWTQRRLFEKKLGKANIYPYLFS